MILQYYISKQDNSSRCQYVLRFINHSLGYNYRIVNNPAKLNKDAPVISFLNSADLDMFGDFNSINIFNSGQLNDLDQAEQSINLFHWSKLNVPVLGKHMSNESLSGWRKNKSDNTMRKTGGRMWSTEIDILVNIFYHLSRYEEKWRHFAEETASDYSTSLLSRYHDLKVPVVDVFLQYFQSLLEKKFDRLVRILPWPGAEPFAAAITHDVDLTRGISLKRRLLNNTYGFYKSLTGSKEVSQQLKQAMKEQDERVWSYPQLIDLYKAHHIRATFFFLTRLMEGVHVRYSVSSKKFKKLLSSLKKNQHEIGLHSSLHAFDHPGRYKGEKERLEEVLEHPVTGLRQHYLRGKFPRLWRIAKNNGFKYDTSLGYNYQAGYRAGTTQPFYTYDYDHDQAYDLVELSLTFFEYNLPKDTESINYIKNLLNQTSTYGGLMVALLHPSNYLQEPYHDLWNSLIQELKKSDAYIDTLKGHYTWFILREQIKITMPSANHIKITKPGEINKFSIQWHGKGVLKLSGKGNLTEVRPGVFTVKSDKNSIDLNIT
jgi:peptidoglycan/xylan/chitin deacetylase (PgdA/CDA1 family)